MHNIGIPTVYHIQLCSTTKKFEGQKWLQIKFTGKEAWCYY